MALKTKENKTTQNMKGEMFRKDLRRALENLASLEKGGLEKISDIFRQVPLKEDVQITIMNSQHLFTAKTANHAGFYTALKEHNELLAPVTGRLIKVPVDRSIKLPGINLPGIDEKHEGGLFASSVIERNMAHMISFVKDTEFHARAPGMTSENFFNAIEYFDRKENARGTVVLKKENYKSSQVIPLYMEYDGKLHVYKPVKENPGLVSGKQTMIVTKSWQDKLSIASCCGKTQTKPFLVAGQTDIVKIEITDVYNSVDVGRLTRGAGHKLGDYIKIQWRDPGKHNSITDGGIPETREMRGFFSMKNVSKLTAFREIVDTMVKALSAYIDT